MPRTTAIARGSRASTFRATWLAPPAAVSAPFKLGFNRRSPRATGAYPDPLQTEILETTLPLPR